MNRPIFNPKSRSESGFVLASTLWVVAALLLIVAAFETYISSELERSHELREKVKESLDLMSAEQSIRYMLLTHRQTLAGLDLQTRNLAEIRNEDGLITLSPVGGELKLDGRVYRGMGKVLFSIQDESGLIAVNAASNFAINSYLEAVGVPNDQVLQYRDRLKDYWDIDDLRRLNGAEESAYVQQTMSPPSNDYLRTHIELKKVMGWNTLLSNLDNLPSALLEKNDAVDYKSQAIKLYSPGRDSKINLNTMPSELLKLFAKDYETIVEQRELQAFRSAADVKSQVPTINNWPDEGFRFFSGSYLRLELWVDGSTTSQVIGLELSPFNLRGPMRERYRLTTHAPFQPRFASADSNILSQQVNFIPFK